MPWMGEGCVDISPDEQQQQMCFAPGPDSVSTPAPSDSAPADAPVSVAPASDASSNPVLASVPPAEAPPNFTPADPAQADQSPAASPDQCGPDGSTPAPGLGAPPTTGPHSQQVYPDNFVGPLQEGQQHVSDITVDGPTQLDNGIGPTTVYPDDFVGPLPPGAMHLGDYKKRVEVYSEIDHGTSQVSVNTDNFMTGPDGKPLDPNSDAGKAAAAKAAAFRSQQMGYLGEALHTDVGYGLLSDLGSAKYTTTIQRSSGATNSTGYDNPGARFSNADGTAGAGTNATVGINPDLTTFAQPGQAEQPWMTERQKYGLYHELVHAYHGVHGDTPSGSHNGTNNREFQAVGLGPYANDQYSENEFRKEMGKDLRPNYGGATW
jgi:hypothetical protein